jgi:hypothetical protein
MSGIYAWATKDTPVSEVHDRVVGRIVKSEAPGAPKAEREIESVWLTESGVWMADLVGGTTIPFEAISAEWD